MVIHIKKDYFLHLSYEDYKYYKNDYFPKTQKNLIKIREMIDKNEIINIFGINIDSKKLKYYTQCLNYQFQCFLSREKCEHDLHILFINLTPIRMIYNYIKEKKRLKRLIESNKDYNINKISEIEEKLDIIKTIFEWYKNDNLI